MFTMLLPFGRDANVKQKDAALKKMYCCFETEGCSVGT